MVKLDRSSETNMNFWVLQIIKFGVVLCIIIYTQLIEKKEYVWKMSNTLLIITERDQRKVWFTCDFVFGRMPAALSHKASLGIMILNKWRTGGKL